MEEKLEIDKNTNLILDNIKLLEDDNITKEKFIKKMFEILEKK